MPLALLIGIAGVASWAADGPTTAPAAGESADVAAVRAKLAQLETAAKAGQTDKLLELFAPQDAASIKALFKAGQEIPTKAAALEKLVTTKLDTELPADLKSSLKKMSSQPKSPAEEFLKHDVSKSTFEQNGDTLVMILDGQRTTLNKVDGQWYMDLGPGRDLILAMSDLTSAAGAVIDAVTAGITSGAITRDNLAEKSREIGDKLMKPASEKFGKLLMEVMVKAMAEGGAPGTKIDPSSAPASHPAKQ
jgi:hypothetical protein